MNELAVPLIFVSFMTGAVFGVVVYRYFQNALRKEIELHCKSRIEKAEKMCRECPMYQNCPLDKS